MATRKKVISAVSMQSDLFGAPAASVTTNSDAASPRKKAGSTGPSVQLARSARGLSELGQHIPANIHMGTSSWSFPGWQNIVYQYPHDLTKDDVNNGDHDEDNRDAIATPSKGMSENFLAKVGLPVYAEHPLFRTVGIDRTFYAPVTRDVFAQYASEVPASFRFLIKAPAILTSVKPLTFGKPADPERPLNEQFLDPARAQEIFVTPVQEGLVEKAGPLLFQFPPQDLRPIGGVEGFYEKLDAFFSNLPQGPLYAVEVRNAPILTKKFVDILAKHKVSPCLNGQYGMPAIDQQAVLFLQDQYDWPALVVRWMLHPRHKYEAAEQVYAPYNRIVDDDPRSRHAISMILRQHCKRYGAGATSKPAFVIVNNKAEGSSPLSIANLARAFADDAG